VCEMDLFVYLILRIIWWHVHLKIMYKKVKFIVILSIVSFNAYAQLNEGVVFVDYAIAPISEDGVDFSKISAKFSYPIKLKKRCFD